MKFNFRFSNLCGVSHKCGNVLFTEDGNMLLSAVGNRVTVFDLVNHSCTTMDFETRKDIKRMCLDHSSRLLVVVDVEGRGMLINFVGRKVLHRFNFKKPVRAMEFSPDNGYLAVSYGRHIQVWETPTLNKEFSPLILHRTYTGHNDDITAISWSPDSRYFVTGSKDMTCRIYSLNPEEDFTVVTLAGHSERIVQTMFLQDIMLDEEIASHVIITISKDGAAIVWEWVWSSEEGAEDLESHNKANRPLSIRHGEWVRHARHFLQKDNARIHSAAMHPNRTDLMVVGFSNGVFSLYEMPSATHIQSLSVSQHELKTAAINCTGEWLALASAKLGQILVWEWKSETYVLKQQGHFYDINVAAYSHDGMLIATGGDDGKVKLWSSNSGFCFVTFSEHNAPITALSFIGEGNAVVSASLDGTVRAFDLVRYRNFKTMTTPSPVQLTCLAVDGQGEVVCAGAMDPPEIYVWSLQTGKLLDVLAGHDGPVSSICFSPTSSSLVSTSWDKTLRYWEPYNATAPKETYDTESDGLCVTFRPDGKEVCVATLNGQLQFWDVASGRQKTVIDGIRDISGGRRAADRVSSKSSAHSKHFTSVCYTADGTCVVAGGRSKFVCIYQVNQGILLKKYQLTHNRSLDGVLDKLNSKNMTEAGPLDLMELSGDESDDGARLAASALPGASRGDLSKRTTRPEIRCKAVKFSPTGQEWAAATTQGLMIYKLDSAMLFDPFQVDENVTPASIRQTANRHEYGKALVLALHLGEQDLIVEIFRSIPEQETKLVARSIPVVYLNRMLELIANEILTTPKIERQLSWVLAILTSHHDRLRTQAPMFISAFRSLQKAISKHEKDMSRLCNENMYMLNLFAAPTRKKSNNNSVLLNLVKPGQSSEQ